jgi:hypothetical protein
VSGIATKDTVAPSNPDSSKTFSYVQKAGATADQVSAGNGALTKDDYMLAIETTPHSGSGFQYLSLPAATNGSVAAFNVEALTSGSVSYDLYAVDAAGNRSAGKVTLNATDLG